MWFQPTQVHANFARIGHTDCKNYGHVVPDLATRTGVRRRNVLSPAGSEPWMSTTCSRTRATPPCHNWRLGIAFTNVHAWKMRARPQTQSSCEPALNATAREASPPSATHTSKRNQMTAREPRDLHSRASEFAESVPVFSLYFWPENRVPWED